MKILEQILEEIEKAEKTEAVFRLTDYFYKEKQQRIMSRVKEIIRSHMEDGTKGLIDVGDERFWNILSEEACVEGVQAGRILKRLKEICAYVL